MGIVFWSVALAVTFLFSISLYAFLKYKKSSNPVGVLDARTLVDSLKLHNHWYCVDDMVSLLKTSPVSLDFDAIVR